jgi:hypothetical protein
VRYAHLPELPTTAARQKVLAGVDEAIGLEVVLAVVELAVVAVGGEQAGVGSALDERAASRTRIGAADVESRWEMTNVERPRREARNCFLAIRETPRR